MFIHNCIILVADLGQCEVKCDTIDGYNAGSKERHGLMPDGTQCNPSSLTSNADIWKLPRWSGMTGRCIMGQCQVHNTFL